MHIKKEVRIIAWDDCAFRFRQKSVLLVGVVFRGGSFIDGLISTKVEKDGTDATDKIASAIVKSRHYDQLSLIMTNGITFAGFNLIDIKKLNRKTGMPVIAVQRERPDMKKFLLAMKRVRSYRKRALMVKNAGTIYSYRDIHFQKSGMNSGNCIKVLDLTCTRAKVPEPLRVAHLIASGLSRKTDNGKFHESRGRA
jgi:endonuclease V-like protein UPF0215 family